MVEYEGAQSEDEATRGLIERVGEVHYRHRLNVQQHHAAQIVGQGTTLFHIENVDWLLEFLRFSLRICCLYGTGNRNAKRIETRTNRVRLPGLPEAFRGFTILHITDLHIDLDPGFVEALTSRLEGIDYDCCVMTGDFRAATSGPYDAAVERMGLLMEHVRQPVYAVPGNHDFIEMVLEMEAMGIRFLLNEHVPLERGGETIYLAGVDDPHMYQADNFHRAGEGIPHDATAVVLSHSPETYRKAAACGFDLMLSGHTHGGQICLPGGIPLTRNCHCQWAMTRGPWSYRDLTGYTSAGSGSCGVPVRFFCPPEIALHVLEP
jgi:uncharacterized protein